MGDTVSTTSKGGSNPVWNEEFYFEPSADVEGISIAVWNSEMLGEEFMVRQRRFAVTFDLIYI
jgi:hypothetical protein